MKNIFRIYIRDMKRLFTNWAAIVIALVIILIPSLYSLTNIKASWDPYGNTSGLKIAVVNKDKGTTYKEQNINLGEDVIDKLQDDDSMDWQFVSEDEASYGLIHEKYYATIVIPEDFSECATSFMENKIVKPQLIYTVNEKKNAIAPKLTDAGAKKVKTKQDENIIKTVSGLVFRIVNETGAEIDGRRDDIRYIIDKIYELDEEMPELEKILDDTIEGVSDADELILKTNDMLPTVSELLDSTSEFVDNSDEIIDKMQDNVNDVAPRIKDDLLKSQELMDNASVTLNNLNETVIPDMAKRSLIVLSENASATKVTVSEVKGMLKSTKTFLKKIIDYDIPEIDVDESILENEKLQELNNKLKEQRESFNDIKDSLKTINKSISVIMNRLDDAEEKLDILINKVNDKITDIDNGEAFDLQALADLKTSVDEVNELLTDIVDSYDSEIVSGINDGFDSVKYILSIAVDLLQEGNDILPHLEEILSSSQDIMDFSTDKLLELKDKFPETKDKVREVADKLREMDEDDKFNEIMDMITNNWEDQSGFMADAVEIENNRLFSWPNYGSSSAPFYMVLCIWVGALITSALLSFNVENLDEGVELKSYEKYLGKLMTFNTLTITGTVVASCGALYWLDVYAVHPIKLILFNMFVAVVFTTIIYTAASLLDDIGKAGIVVIMVLQIAGTNGTFPIEVNPLIFQKIFNYLPFTYAVNGIRQILAGIVYPILIKDIKMLSIYLVVSLIVGITLKKPFNKVSDMIVDKLNESGILRH